MIGKEVRKAEPRGNEDKMTDNVKCKCCGSRKLKILIDFGMQPVAHNLLDNKDQQDSYSHLLCLHYCEECGFIQINDPIPPEKLYTGYNYCFSDWKKQPHIPAEIKMLNKHIKNKDIGILEIGCNDGVFLSPLRQEGYGNLVGIEANPYAAKDAKANGFDILNMMFNKKAAEKIKEQYSCFDLVIMRQVLEHIPDLDAFFEALDMILGGEKLLLIEVPDFSEAFKYGDCSTIWEEHPNYFTYRVLELLLRRKGYTIIDKDFYDFSGGAMCVLAGREESQAVDMENVDLLEYEKFSGVISNYAQKLNSALMDVRTNGTKVFLYGTGARACTLVNGLGLKEKIDAAIDDQKEKQGHYMPGCHLPILSIDEAGSGKGRKLFLLAVNHENEEAVSKKIQEFYDGENIEIISLFAPNDILEEVRKIRK